MKEHLFLPAEPARDDIARSPAQLVRVPEAARITGLPRSLIRKSFICDAKRPKNIPSPPPHKRIGRSVYIVVDLLSAWVRNLGSPAANVEKHRRGRPTVARRIASRKAEIS
jgi:hypothetical protein